MEILHNTNNINIEKYSDEKYQSLKTEDSSIINNNNNQFLQIKEIKSILDSL